PRAPRPALFEGPREDAGRARQGQEAIRQARKREGARLAARAAAAPSQARLAPQRRGPRVAGLWKLGWLMGFEPTTTGITIRDSTAELQPPSVANTRQPREKRPGAPDRIR